METSLLLTFASAIISAIAIYVSLRTAKDQRHLSKYLAEEEHALMFEQVRIQRDSDIIDWTKNCVEVLSQCEIYISRPSASNGNDERQKRFNELCWLLSARIDQGRLYFPNQAPESKGHHKPQAYRGERQLVLTVLVRAYDVFSTCEDLRDPDQIQEVVKSLNDLRRLFVSEVQIAIDPRRYIALQDMNEIKRSKGFQAQDVLGDEDV